ncbi:MAG: SIR2 family protein [Candidatus Symbiobacter sp.]|nr:SIR2 family protein [Candidatus Symbiobacter sp.]
MKFVADGPDINDQLLHELESGRVMIFCGAGVSMQAGLPDFRGLVKQVYEALNEPIPTEDDARWNKLDSMMGRLEKKIVEGMMRQEAVKILSKECSKYPDHANLLKLAKLNGEDKYRLITTNFDHYFESAAHELDFGKDDIYYQVSQLKPALEIPRDEYFNDWRGILHLHGRLDQQNQKGANDHLILNNADYGRAYFSSDYITRFLLRLFREFTVLFIGYSLNDPPIAYILDALGSEATGKKHYIFVDAESAKEATNYDNNDSIKIIEYSLRGKSHESLYETLAIWANAHQDMKGYIKKEIIAKFAQYLPEQLDDLEIDQVIWAVRDDSDKLDGAVAFYNHEPTPPVEWLEIFKENLSDKLENIFIESANFSRTERLIFAWMSKHLDKIEMLDWIAENNGRYKYLNSHFRQVLRTILGIPHTTWDSHFPLSKLSPAFAKFWSIIASDSNFARSYLQNGSWTVMNFIHNPNNDIAQIEFLAALEPMLHITKMQSHDSLSENSEFYDLVATDVELQCQQRGEDKLSIVSDNIGLLLSYNDIYCIAFPTLLPEIEKKYLRAIELDLRYTKEHQFGNFWYHDYNYKYHVLIRLLDISWKYINLSFFNEGDIRNKFDILSRWVGYGLTPFTYLAAQCLSQVRESEADQAFQIIKKIGVYHREQIYINGKRVNNHIPFEELLGKIGIIGFVSRIFKYLSHENQNYIIDSILNSHPYSDLESYKGANRKDLQKYAKIDICKNLEILKNSGATLPNHANELLASFETLKVEFLKESTDESPNSEQDIWFPQYEPRQSFDFTGKRAKEVLDLIAKDPKNNSWDWQEFNSQKIKNIYRAIAVLMGLKNHPAGKHSIVWIYAFHCIKHGLNKPNVARRVISLLRQIPIELLVNMDIAWDMLCEEIYFAEKLIYPKEEAILFWKIWNKNREESYKHKNQFKKFDLKYDFFYKEDSDPITNHNLWKEHPISKCIFVLEGIYLKLYQDKSKNIIKEFRPHLMRLLDHNNEQNKYARYLIAHYLNDHNYGGLRFGYMRHDRDFILNHFVPFFDWKHPSQDAVILWQLIDFPHQNLLFYPPLWEKINGYFFDSFEHISGFSNETRTRFINFAFFAGIRFHDDKVVIAKLRQALKHCPADLLANVLSVISHIMERNGIQDYFNCLPPEIADNHFAAQGWFWQNRLWPVINQAWPKYRDLNTDKTVKNFLKIISNCGDNIADALTKLEPYLHQFDDYGFMYFNNLTQSKNFDQLSLENQTALKRLSSYFKKLDHNPFAP